MLVVAAGNQIPPTFESLLPDWQRQQTILRFDFIFLKKFKKYLRKILTIFSISLIFLTIVQISDISDNLWARGGRKLCDQPSLLLGGNIQKSFF